MYEYSMMSLWMYEQSAEDDIIDGNEQQFHDVADSSHNGEPDGAGGRNFLELYIAQHLPATSGFSHTYKNRLLSP